MRRTPPPLNWFRVFEASARHLKFTHAAVELGMTQSAVSQQIRAFEARLGVQLFVRKPRGLALSDAGRKLVPKIEAALNDLDAAGRMFDPKPKEGLVTIACSVSIAQWIIAPHLAQFHAL
ncbi:MAG: LysR family transcriptional regulator, partial [Paracoccaceae bacterium]|nr:LysR family transcriptional regulator [Paracoccaceae bacterium]